MLLLPSAWTYEAGLPSKAKTPELWDTIVPIISGTCADVVCSSLPQHGPGEPISVPRCYTSTYYFADGHMGQGMGRGQGQDFQAETLRIQGHVYTVIQKAKLAYQSNIHGTFLLSHFLTRMLFNFGCIIFIFVVASCVRGLGLEVETLEKHLYVGSSLGARVSVDLICRGYELEISEILLTVDLRVRDMLEFDVILGMYWLTTHRVVIDCERRRVIAYTHDGVSVAFQGDKHDVLPQTVYDSKWHGQLMGWLANLTLEDEVRQDLDLPRVVCEHEDVFCRRAIGITSVEGCKLMY